MSNQSDNQTPQGSDGQQPSYQFGQDPTSSSGQSASPYGSLPPADTSATGGNSPSSYGDQSAAPSYEQSPSAPTYDSASSYGSTPQPSSAPTYDSASSYGAYGSTPQSSPAPSYGSPYGAQDQANYYGSNQAGTTAYGAYQNPNQTGMVPAYGTQTQQPQENNPIGLIALILSIIGTIISCIPIASIFGWVILAAAFVMGIVAICLANKKKLTGILAIVISIVGGIISVVISLVLTFSLLNSNLDDSSLSDYYSDSMSDSNTSPDSTREEPLPLGSTVTGGEWSVTINGVNLDATDAVLAAESYVDGPAAGNVFIAVDTTITYTGDNSAGEQPSLVRIEYVSSSGNTFDKEVYIFSEEGNYLNKLETLYNGASISGEYVLEVPKDGVENGVIRVTPGGHYDSPSFIAMK